MLCMTNTNTIKNFYNDDDYIYCVNPMDSEPIMFLVGGVGDVIDGNRFAKELYSLVAKNPSKICIYINSTGGSVIDGMSIYSAIVDSKIEIDTYNIGVALSISAIIFLSGKKRIMLDYSRLMFHSPYNEDGSVDEGLAEIKESLITMIAGDKTKEKEVELMLNKETWLNPEEALSVGFATEIKPTSENRKRSMDDKTEIELKYNFASLIMNRFVDEEKNKKEKTNMKRTSKKNSAEISTTTKVPVLKNETTEELEEQLETLEEKIERQELNDSVEEEIMNDDCNTSYSDDEMTSYSDDDKSKIIMDLQNELKVIKDELKELKLLKNKAEVEALNSKINNMLDGFVKAGKISGDTESLADWRASAQDNYDFTVRLINRLPVTKSAVSFEVKNNSKIESVGNGNSVALRMKELQDKAKGKVK